jgi:hypothetical protein
MILQPISDNPEYADGFNCDVCMAGFGPEDGRANCQVCKNYDLCQPCFEKSAVSADHQASHEVKKYGIFIATEKVKPVAEDGIEHAKPGAEDSAENAKPGAEDGAENVKLVAEDGAMEGRGFTCGVCKKDFDDCTARARCVECEDYYLCRPCFEEGKVSKDHDSSHEIHDSEDAKRNEPSNAERAADGTTPEEVAQKPPVIALPKIQARYWEIMEERRIAQQAKELGVEAPENPWGAVCVIECRIYSKQADMDISLVQTKMGEASTLENVGK